MKDAPVIPATDLRSPPGDCFSEHPGTPTEAQTRRPNRSQTVLAPRELTSGQAARRRETMAQRGRAGTRVDHPGSRLALPAASRGPFARVNHSFLRGEMKVILILSLTF